MPAQHRPPCTAQNLILAPADTTARDNVIHSMPLPCCADDGDENKCEAQILSHTATTANPRLPTAQQIPCPGPPRWKTAPAHHRAYRTDSAVSGTPFSLPRKQAGSVRSFDNDHSMRPEAYNPEFAAERIAVRITKLKISAAYGSRPLSQIPAQTGFFHARLLHRDQRRQHKHGADKEK